MLASIDCLAIWVKGLVEDCKRLISEKNGGWKRKIPMWSCRLTELQPRWFSLEGILIVGCELWLTSSANPHAHLIAPRPVSILSLNTWINPCVVTSFTPHSARSR